MLKWLKWGPLGVQARPVDSIESAASAIAGLIDFSRSVSEYLTGLSKLGIVQSKEMTVTMDGSTSANYFVHGLPGGFRGVIVVGQTYETTPVCAMSPDAVKAAGQDPTRVVGLRMASGNPAVVNLVVY